jgi:hypothetical protein
MASDAEGTERFQWLLEPAGPGMIKLYLEIGEGTELTAEAREAIENLVASLNSPSGEDAAGYQVFRPRCPARKDPCQPYVTLCYRREDCKTYGPCMGYSCNISDPNY